jgi:FRG domain
VVEKLQKQAGTPLWFRGAGLAVHDLVPSLYRHPGLSRQDEFEALEKQLLGRFRQRSIPYHTRNLADYWEAIFFMQHYGVPTRLLDWTENPLTALHFALMTAPLVAGLNSGAPVRYARQAAVWVLDPYLWNRSALARISYDGGPFTPGDADLRVYSAETTALPTDSFPVALYGAHNSARIVAQQGVFVTFGAKRVPMQALVRQGRFPRKALSRIVVQGSQILEMRKSLLNQGITESTVFPDLDGLAREIKRHFGFEA